MPDQEAVAALIERVIAGACIPSRAERDDLRRELWTHFEEAGTSPDSVGYVLRRFGDESMITESLRRVYRWDYAALYAAKLVASVIVSFAAALLIVALVNLRVELETEVWRLAPGFSRAAGVALAVALGLVAAWEVVRRPFSLSRAALAIGAYAAVCGLMDLLVVHSAGAFVTAIVFVVLGDLCSRLPSRPLRWLLTFVAFAAAEYGVHFVLSVALAPSRAAMAGAILVAVWASTVVVLTYADHAFVHLFDAAQR
ncbi:MAG TPA: hypothetical protein VG222_15115 [Vicinamibacterales bacterium]|nr:hypothetical protein [Vicinamibacterales bacterium]